MKCIHCHEAVTINKQGHAIGFHRELTCHKSPTRVHVAEEAPMSSTPETATMTDDEAIETLVRVDEERLSDDEPAETPKQVILPPAGSTTEGLTVKPTQGAIGMFHVLSEIDDGVFVAWDRCHNGSSRHSIAECKCKGGPTEPPYVTKWRLEYIAKRDKKAAKVRDYAAEDLAQREADARQIQENEELAATVSGGIEAATEAVQAAATEEVASDNA